MNKIVKNIPEINALDDEVTLNEKFKHHLYAVLRTDNYTTFYILRERGSENLDTADYFIVTINVERGRIVCVNSNERAHTIRYIIDTEFNNIACNALSLIDEKDANMVIHWPEPDKDEEE
jgi:hypothetical protein